MSLLNKKQQEEMKCYNKYDDKGNVIMDIKEENIVSCGLGVVIDMAKTRPYKWIENKGYLLSKRCYLAGAISMDSGDGIGWRSEITPRLEEFGVIVDDPCKTTIASGKGEIGADKAYFRGLIKERKFEQLKKEFYPIVRKDLRSVDLANFIILGHDPEIPTVGTIHEIVIATHIEKKPVLLFCPEEKLDKINPWMLTLVKKQWIFTNWDDMFKYLEKINSGDLDTSHWVL